MDECAFKSNKTLPNNMGSVFVRVRGCSSTEVLRCTHVHRCAHFVSTPFALCNPLSHNAEHGMLILKNAHGEMRNAHGATRSPSICLFAISPTLLLPSTLTVATFGCWFRHHVWGGDVVSYVLRPTSLHSIYPRVSVAVSARCSGESFYHRENDLQFTRLHAH